jgi:hypothetical protein
MKCNVFFLTDGALCKIHGWLLEGPISERTVNIGHP